MCVVSMASMSIHSRSKKSTAASYKVVTPMMNNVVLVSRAADFAARQHVGQRRKGIAQEPYINHLAEVALLIADATEGADPELVAAAWLHDTVEDTETTREDLEQTFGS